MNLHEQEFDGTIAGCVLGIASEEECREFASLCKQYPALIEKRNAFEIALERQILTGGTHPPAYVYHQLVLKIKRVPAVGQNTPQRRNLVEKFFLTGGITKYFAAAAIFLLLACGYFLYRLQVQGASLAQANAKLLQKVGYKDSLLNSLAKKAMAGNAGAAVVHLTGETTLVRPKADIYWDSATTAVYLVVRYLPALPQDKQYQLWAQVDGKPKSLGVFDAASDKVILKMTNTKKAEAFAITVEPKGGNTSPSPRVQAAGKTKGL